MTAIVNRLSSLTSKVDSKGANWKAILFWGLVIGLGIFCLWYFKVEPFYGWTVSVGSWAGSTIGNLTSDLNVESVGNQITAYIQANPIIAVTGIIGVSGGILALYERSQRIRESNLKLAEQEARVYAETQAGAVTENLVYYKQQAASATAELTAIKETNIAQQLEIAKTEIQTLTYANAGAERTIAELQEQVRRYDPEKISQAIKDASRVR